MRTKYHQYRMEQKRILIIGGSRFSGKQLMLKLAAENHKITVINRGKAAIEYPSNVNHIIADRMDSEKMIEILKDQNFDWIFDYVAWQGYESKVLIDLFQNKIEKLIHISTGNYYNLENPETYLTQPIFEDDGMGPISETTDAYSKGKRMLEQDLMSAYNETGFPVTIIRPTFIFGPDNYFERESYFFKRQLANRPLLLLSPGFGYDDFIYAEDLAKLCLLAAKSSKSTGQAYNASCGEVMCGEQLAKLVDVWCKELDPTHKETEIHYYSNDDLKSIEWPENKPLYPFTANDIMMFSPRKAIVDLGFHPRRLQEGLKQTFEWYLNKFSKINNLDDEWADEDRLISYVKEK